MKIPPSLSRIDPAFYYLAGFVLVVGVLVVVGNYLMPPTGAGIHRMHRPFPTESEVHSLIHPGQSKEDVLSEFGEPSLRGPLQDGLEVLDYYMPMSQVPPNDPAVYVGFAVYLKNDQVAAVNIIRGSDLRN